MSGEENGGDADDAEDYGDKHDGSNINNTLAPSMSEHVPKGYEPAHAVLRQQELASNSKGRAAHPNPKPKVNKPQAKRKGTKPNVDKTLATCKPATPKAIKTVANSKQDPRYM